MKRITSRENPAYRLLRTLAESSRERRKQCRTLLDGMHLLAAYAERYGLPELLAVSEHGLAQPEIAAFLAANPRGNVLLFGDGLFKEISPVTTPTGILASIPVPAQAVPAHWSGSCVLLDAIQDAGNLGSILRSAAAAAIPDVFLGPGCAQAWAPRVLRAAMGAHFTLNIHEHVALHQVLSQFSGASVATGLQGGRSIHELDLAGPVAWLFGNEGAGLTADLLQATSQSAFIPMPGKAESLNVAAAAAVCLFEEVRQKAERKRRAECA
jgi:TrmH family RNA methyltransferase